MGFDHAFHAGRVSALFADGHAESLRVKETAGHRLADGRGRPEFVQWTAVADRDPPRPQTSEALRTSEVFAA